jgi:hypothetical protein
MVTPIEENKILKTLHVHLIQLRKKMKTIMLLNFITITAIISFFIYFNNI